MKIMATNSQDNKTGFYRIVQPLRMLKRSGWEARTVPFRGNNTISQLPIHDELLVRLSKNTDFILTSPVYDEKELLRIMNLRRLNNCRWVVDIAENIYVNGNIQRNWPVIEKSLIAADGVIVSTPTLKELYREFNENIYIMRSALDFKIWDMKATVSRKFKVGYLGGKEDLEIVSPTLKELVKEYPIEFVNLHIDGVLDQPKQLAKKGVSIALFPLEDSDFNRYRNNIDVLEQLSLKIPIVASPVESLRGLPILYADSNYFWYENIEKLIKDKQFRQKMAKEAHDFVRKNYDVTNLVKDLKVWLQKLTRRDY